MQPNCSIQLYCAFLSLRIWVEVPNSRLGDCCFTWQKSGQISRIVLSMRFLPFQRLYPLPCCACMTISKKEQVDEFINLHADWMWIAELHQAFFVVIDFLRLRVSFCNLDNLLNRGNIFLVTWQIKWWDSQFLWPSFLMLFFHLLQDSKCPRLISIISERSSFSSTQVCHDLLKIGVKEGKGQFLS